MSSPCPIFVAGGTGYLGQALLPELVVRGCPVTALTRAASQHKLPAGVRPVVGNALDHTTYVASVPPSAMFIHLVGVPHPAPWKARQFREIDLVSLKESLRAAKQSQASHFLYLSVAQPAPLMKAYQAVRAEGERLVRESGLPATFLRPWYILGPGHRWPSLLLPLYRLAERFPATRGGAERLGLVTLPEMVAALTTIATWPGEGVRVVDVPGIRGYGWRAASAKA